MIKAYEGIITKQEFVSEMKAHQKADDFVRGTYESIVKGEFKGCAVGCSLESIKRTKKLEIDVSDHSQYPELLGVPEWLARIEDRIFEGAGPKRAKTWPVEFAEAINTGSDLEKIKGPFLIVIMKITLDKFDHAKFPAVKAAIDRVISCWENPLTTQDEFMEARRAADADADADAAAAAAAAAYAAAAAAYAAAAAAYADADADAAAADAAAAAAAAAYAYAYADAAAAYADADADAAAAAAADAAAAYAYAYAAAAYAYADAAAARRKTYEYFADELLKLLRECK